MATAHDLRAQFEALIGAQHVLGPESNLDHYNKENRGIHCGDAALVLRPANTQEVSAIAALAYAHDIPMVAQGGHTGHAAGGVAFAGQIVISTERMQAIRAIDPANGSMVVDAGVILEDIHTAALAHDCFYPVSLASKGSCRIGGNVASNAGGTAVLAYGNTRDNILGLEVVLADGRVWNGLRALKKDNTGYDLKHMFIGSEGSLGIITGVCLKLWPKPRGKEVAFAALQDPDQALAFFNCLRGFASQSLTAFELMPRTPFEFTLAYQPSIRDPFAGQAYPWYALVEFSSTRSAEDARSLAETTLSHALEQGLCLDLVLADSSAQQAALWAIRETMPAAQAPHGWSIKHDTAVPVQSIPEFYRRADAIVHASLPGARICAFGHMGDGNVHYNITQPEGAPKALYEDKRQEINAKIHALVAEMGGSVSAEHGVGLLRKQALATYADPLELEMMRSIKRALDPKGLMNPGKIFDL